ARRRQVRRRARGGLRRNRGKRQDDQGSCPVAAQRARASEGQLAADGAFPRRAGVEPEIEAAEIAGNPHVPRVVIRGGSERSHLRYRSLPGKIQKFAGLATEPTEPSEKKLLCGLGGLRGQSGTSAT